MPFLAASFPTQSCAIYKPVSVSRRKAGGNHSTNPRNEEWLPPIGLREYDQSCAIYKPVSVSRRKAGGNHSSRPAITDRLKRPTRKL